MYDSGKFVKIDGKMYYEKPGVEGYAYTEVIAMRLAELLGIRCAKYETTEIDGEAYYLSEYLGDNFSSLIKKVDVLNNNLYDIWDRLEKKYNNADELMMDIVKIYLFDILFLNCDRDVSNIGIIIENKKPSIIMFDNELLFSSSIMLSSKYSSSDKVNGFKKSKYKNYDEIYLHNMEDLDYFLATSDKKFMELFVNMYNTATPEVVEQIVKEEDPSILDEVMKMYNINYKLIGDILKERNR